jgi:hypothetical protein
MNIETKINEIQELLDDTQARLDKTEKQFHQNIKSLTYDFTESINILITTKLNLLTKLDLLKALNQ